MKEESLIAEFEQALGIVPPSTATLADREETTLKAVRTLTGRDKDVVDEVVTWSRVIAQEPRLKTLLNQASTVDGRDPCFSANVVWLKEFKPQLVKLVGWYASDSQPDWMHSQAAYDVAYQTIYQSLPPCKDCN